MRLARRRAERELQGRAHFCAAVGLQRLHEVDRVGHIGTVSLHAVGKQRVGIRVELNDVEQVPGLQCVDGELQGALRLGH